MTWKMYIFVRPKSKTGKNWSKGKIVGQVGHACMRLGNHLERFGGSEYAKYLEDGEIKLVFKVYEFPLYIDKGGYKLPSDVLGNVDLMYNGSVSWSYVKDNTSGEYIALAILTNKEMDTRRFKLL
jgi:hypothetical protein